MTLQLKKLTEKLREDPDYSCSWGLKDVNRPKNRYKDIVPYDKSRVILPKCDGVPGSDYINASYIKGASGAFAYIAAQGPLPNTVIDFWRMIWICDVQVIVMACNEKEAGKSKCEVYWPTKEEIIHYGNISVELIETSQVCPDFLIRTLLVKCDSEMRDIYQFHYTSWPDHGVPDTVQPMLELVRLMRDCQASETVPIVVHCSAGCGRTGTICAVDFVWTCLRHGKLTEDFSLFQIALELRRQRIAMIQTKEQYILAHKAVAYLFEQQLNVIDCHTYVNVDEVGEPLMWNELSKNKFTLFKKESSSLKEHSSSHNNTTNDNSEQKITAHTEDLTNKFAERDFFKRESTNISEKSSVSNNQMDVDVNSSDSMLNSYRNSETSISRNSCLSKQGSEDTIPFIDDDEICVRPNCGRAYLNLPNSSSFSKIINHFDPFVDKIILDTDDSSPDGDIGNFPTKIADIQSDSSKKLNSSAISMSNSRNDINSENSDQIFSNNYATLPCGSSFNKNLEKANNRDSYPPSSRLGKYDDAVSDIIEDKDNKGSKKIGKATVVRRPSISKLKALFEKSGLSSNKSTNEGGKRSLFRNNSHSVSRAGSAPPSLDCMDKNSAVERESILMLVTRKFRSASVRTEREINSKSGDKSQHRKSTSGSMTNFKEGFASLSRTVSFNLNRTFKSYSPSKNRVEKPSVSESGNVSFTEDCSTSESSKSKLPEVQPKGKSMWYDKSSLPRAVAIVKPTSPVLTTPSADVPISPTAKKGTGKNAFSSVINKPPKLLPLFGTLNKPSNRDITTMWYNEIDEVSNIETASTKSAPIMEHTKITKKPQHNRVLPFIQSIAPWKKNSKSPLISPESPKNFIEMQRDNSNVVGTSKFYTNIENLNKKIDLPLKDVAVETSTCPVPEEIIPLNTISKEDNFVEKEKCDLSRSLTKPLESQKTDNLMEQIKNNSSVEQVKNSDYVKQVKNNSSEKLDKNNGSIEKDKKGNSMEQDESDKSIEGDKCKGSLEQGEDSVEQSKNDQLEQSKNNDLIEHSKSNTEAILDKTTISVEASVDLPPAIPKKMVIGKQKFFENQIFFNEHETLPNIETIASDNKNVPTKRKDSISKPAMEGKIESPSLSPKDHYINVNVKALKNIEQIENTLRNNPRSAIIDLTSRESYCMEEDLDNAVKRLSKPSEENKTSVVKNSSKFPGYEVIWPEGDYSKDKYAQNSNSENKFRCFMLKESNSSNLSKTGLCYSPPLRRSVNTQLGLAKCRSCSNIDWLEPNENVSIVEDGNSKDLTSTPTKKLVNEAVVELNTLLDRLTTQTLSEDPGFVAKSNQVHDTVEEKKDVSSNKWIEKDNLVTHSVTIVSKSNLDSSPKEEEIVFHFPPPPPLPPPEDDQPSETFNIVRKNGSIIVTEKNETKESSTDPLCIKDCSTDSVNYSDNSLSECPQPTPRKSKQGGLRRSASYTNMCVPQNKGKGYENVFLEKYQTLSRLQISSKEDNHEQVRLNVNSKPSRSKPQISRVKPDYVNIEELFISNSPKNIRKSPKRDLDKDCSPVKISVEDAKQQHTANPFKVSKQSYVNVDMSKSCPPSEFKSDPIFSVVNNDTHSIYGKICKISDKRFLDSENTQNQRFVSAESILEDIKRKPLPSKKSERAPLPPNISRIMESHPQKMESPKKLPSRKLEKAPLPPPLLQKSSTGVSLAKKNLPNSSHYMNYAPYRTHIADETPALAAVRENISNNDLPNSTICANPCRSDMKSSKSPILSHGLSHSQSDASVFLALKERKMQPLNKGLKIVDSNPKLMNKILKQKKELVSLSSSDSDSSYERIFFEKPPEQSIKASSKPSIKEQIVLNSPKSYKKELPVAPPRSKRRNTTEIHYAKVKSKEASPFSNISPSIPDQQKLCGKVFPSIPEPPPAIPMKTKDAFEIPDEFGIKGNDRATGKILDNSSSSNFRR
ncbi:tyrosine-protein phosphatase non-receptor type 12 [Trichonephila clavata]|uniref:protein-tyrosine-phosphatase n=1 Tax=Trichonephila clavata TaxID=2740835 RepID=A0A8X6LZ90_TRICU|nr:tyrosine-protein phosphatase non-receptor type 12 [Trichonephila clavata]